MEEGRSSENLEPVRSKKILITEKRCCVPKCRNSSRNLPDLTFFLVPKSTFRYEVYDAIQAGTGVRPACSSVTSAVYVCEYHYKLETDVEFWNKCNPKTASTPYPIKLKKGVLPHIFPSPVDPELSSSSLPSVSTLQQTSAELSTTAIAFSQCAASCAQDTGSAANNDFAEKFPSKSDQLEPEKAEKECSCKDSRHARHKSRIYDSPLSSTSQNTSSPTKSVNDSDYLPSTSSFSSVNTDFDAFDASTFQFQCKTVNEKLCLDNSKAFLGIDEDKLSILNVLRKHVGRKQCERDILIVLRKIKLNESFKILGLYFGISLSQVSRIFDDVLPIISKCFKTLIFKPPLKNLYLNLPCSFRSKYFSVTDIIDAFEIETEKPSDPVNQALTWSDYKHCNTFKILISSAPDGHINYVSRAYGGRISDSLLAVESGYLESLAANSTVLADRGFKHLESDLAAKNCILLRPPSISADEVLSEEQSIVTKQIAALRIHIERVIGRIREFAILAPHARVDHYLTGKLDDMVFVAAGLVNLQSKITRF